MFTAPTVAKRKFSAGAALGLVDSGEHALRRQEY